MHIGVIDTAVLLFAFRRDLVWSWWAMWVLPAWAVGGFVSYLVATLLPSTKAASNSPRCWRTGSNMPPHNRS